MTTRPDRGDALADVCSLLPQLACDELLVLGYLARRLHGPVSPGDELVAALPAMGESDVRRLLEQVYVGMGEVRRMLLTWAEEG